VKCKKGKIAGRVSQSVQHNTHAFNTVHTSRDSSPLV
jgi:hypothetical protein